LEEWLEQTRTAQALLCLEQALAHQLATLVLVVEELETIMD
jgi:hypothetical protein